MLCRMAISLVFDGHVRSVGALGLDIFLTFTIASATELPADTFLTLVMDKWGRRWLACGSMVLSGVFSLLSISVPTGNPDRSAAAEAPIKRPILFQEYYPPRWLSSEGF